MSARTDPKTGAEASVAGPHAETYSRMQQLADDFSGGITLQRKATQSVSIASSAAVVQRVALTDPEFRRALTEHIFGDGTSYPTIYGMMNRAQFITDLMRERADNDSSRVQGLGTMAWQFVRDMDAALKYRADNAQTVRDMKLDNPNANFGDIGPDGVRLIGGTGNPWPSVHVNQLPAYMRNRVTMYIPNLHNSVSMGGNGYDYRPGAGVLFHIRR